MLCFLLGLFLLQVSSPAPRPGNAPDQAQPTPPAVSQPEPKLPTGPLRVELTGLIETRMQFLNEGFARGARPGMRVRYQLTGERLGDIVRVGRPIIEKMIDDRGKSYSDASIDEASKNVTTPVNITKAMAAQGGLDMGNEVEVSGRDARRVTSLVGRLNIVLGSDTQSITLRQALSRQGETINDPQLEKMGISVRVAKTSEVTESPNEKGVGLLVLSGEEKIKSLDVYDDWLRKIQGRTRTGRTKDGMPYVWTSLFTGPSLNDDAQLVLEVYTNAQTQTLTFDFKDLALP